MCRQGAPAKSKVYVVILRDTHFGTEAEVFYDSISAINYARSHALNYAVDLDDVVEQDIDGTLYYARYHPDSSVWVVEKEMK